MATEELMQDSGPSTHLDNFEEATTNVSEFAQVVFNNIQECYTPGEITLSYMYKLQWSYSTCLFLCPLIFHKTLHLHVPSTHPSIILIPVDMYRWILK